MRPAYDHLRVSIVSPVLLLAICLTIESAGTSFAQSSRASRNSAATAAQKKQEDRFIEGLWERGYFDLAGDYVAELKKQNRLDASQIAWLDARSAYEEASSAPDLARRRTLLEQSIQKMRVAIGGIKDPAKADDARLVQVRATIELAHLIWVDSQDQPTASQTDVLLKQSRARQEEARKVNAALLASLSAREKTFKLPVLPDDPRRPDFERTQLDRLNAELQTALIDYEDAQSWPAKSPERTKLLTRAMETLRKLHEVNRGQVAGQNARLWQAKCLQELGNLPEASGIYGELVDQADPALRELRCRAMYFRIIVYRDRGDFALAADECRRWLDAYPDQSRTEDGIGVQLELARNIILQLPKAAPNERAAGERVARERLGSVIRVYSRHQAEARKLLAQLRKNAPDIPPEKLDYTAALAAGQEAMELKDYTRAGKCFEAAANKAAKAKENGNYVKARYFEAVCLFRAESYYDAYVLGSHLARRYPSDTLAPNAAEIALAAMTYAYNAYKSVDPVSDLTRLIEMAQYTAKTWPQSAQADTARVTLGEVYRGQGKYDEAASILKSVGKNSEQFGEAQAKLGLVLWRKSQSLSGPASTAATNEAITAFRNSLSSRLAKGVPADDTGIITTQLDLADVLSLTGKAGESLKLIADAEKAAVKAPADLNARVQRLKVRSLIASDQLDQALADLATAEKSGLDVADLSALYFQLGQSLQDEMASLKAANDGKFVRVRQSYQSFLKALSSSRAGESWQSLQWVAEAQLEDDQSAAALQTLSKIKTQYLDNESFKADPANTQRISRSQIKTVEAARRAGQYPLAASTLRELESKSPNLLPVIMEKGRLLEAQGKLNDAFAHWRGLTTRLATAKPRPDEYYQAWLEFAGVLEKQGKAATARQTLAGVLRLGGTSFPAQWKQAFDAEIKRLSGPSTKKAGATR
jgi:TolA-binding protein